MSPTPIPTARRNLAWRIEHFLRAHTPTDWQADQVLVAIEMLEEERFSEGERAMMYVEKPEVWGPVEYVSVDPKDARQLLGVLKKVQTA